MELLGERNWWLPRWLDRLLPTLNVEGDHHAIDHPQSEPASDAAEPADEATEQPAPA
jgi:RND superfamily putative drug exporter